MNYLDKLRQSAKKTGSIACLGLDPVVEAMPELCAKEGIMGATHYFEILLNQMKNQGVLPGALKPNQGFFLKHNRPRERDFSGSRALAGVMDLIETIFPETPIILDYKRGDIATSSANYAEEGFKSWQADAVTIPPYFGYDGVLPFAGRNPKKLEEAAKYCNNEAGKGVYILVRTSNPGAKDIQDLEVVVRDKTMPLYEAVAHQVMDWSKDNPGIGAVVGATSPEELSNILGIINQYEQSQIPLLIPGVGSQGGSASEVTKRLRDSSYELPLVRINSSSGITHPWQKKKQPVPDNFSMVCVEELHKLNEQINYKAA